MSDAEWTSILDRYCDGFPNDLKSIVAFLKQEPKGEVVARLASFLTSTEDRYSNSAFVLLLEVDPKSAIGRASELVASANCNDRYFAYANIGNRGSPEFVRLLSKAVIEEPNDNARYRAVEALGNCGSLQEITLLEEVAATDKGTDFEGRLISQAASDGIMLTRLRSESKASGCEQTAILIQLRST